MTLIELADRCEAATEPNRELDEALAQAVGWQLLEMSNFDSGRMWYEWKRPDGARLPIGTLAEPPFYTASLDAAMTLVPEGRCWRVATRPKNTAGPKAGALVEAAPDSFGATPALALCAAALKACAACS